ncbi:hypothetical protein COOONC_12174 [Cooperia oncophora]
MMLIAAPVALAVQSDEELTPDAEKLTQLSQKLNEVVQNFTLGIIPTTTLPSEVETTAADDIPVINTSKDEVLEETTVYDRGYELQHKTTVKDWNPMISPTTRYPYREQSVRRPYEHGQDLDKRDDSTG